MLFFSLKIQRLFLVQWLQSKDWYKLEIKWKNKLLEKSVRLAVLSLVILVYLATMDNPLHSDV